MPQASAVASPSSERVTPSTATPSQPSASPIQPAAARRSPRHALPSATKSGVVAASSATSPEGTCAEATQAQAR
jgi:hypothetical protein